MIESNSFNHLYYLTVNDPEKSWEFLGKDIEKLDFDHVSKTNDLVELKSILCVLTLGKKGHYPELMDLIKKKILGLLPNKERKQIVALTSTLNLVEVRTEKHKIDEWLKCINQEDNHGDVIFQSNEVKNGTERSVRHIPDIRNARSVKNKQTSNACYSNSSKYMKEPISIFNGAIKKTADEDKIGDPILKPTSIITREEKVEKMIKQRLLEQERLRIKIDYEFLTVKERNFQFIREKEKGDEYFRCKEFDKSYLHYSRSIAFDSRNPIVYANRAMSSIKLSNLNDALLDCTDALDIDRTYTKVFARRGMVYHKCGRYLEAIDDFTICLEQEPQNKEYKKLLNLSTKKFWDVNSADKKMKNKIIIEDAAYTNKKHLKKGEKVMKYPTEKNFTPGVTEVLK